MVGIKALRMGRVNGAIMAMENKCKSSWLDWLDVGFNHPGLSHSLQSFGRSSPNRKAIACRKTSKI
jgi:hypothetical protein